LYSKLLNKGGRGYIRATSTINNRRASFALDGASAMKHALPQFILGTSLNIEGSPND